MSTSDRKELLRNRYAPIYTLASTVQFFGFGLMAGNGIIALIVLSANLPWSLSTIGAGLFATIGIGCFGLARISAAMLRAFGDIAVWTAPGLSDDDRLTVAQAAGGGGSGADSAFAKSIGM